MSHVTLETLPKVFEEWKKLYQGRSYLLARLAIEDLVETMPQLPDGWFLMGLSDLGVRDARRAAESFRKAKEALNKPKAPTLSHEFARLGQVLDAALGALDRRVTLVPPNPWDEWLQHPERVGSVHSVFDRIASNPIGLSQSLSHQLGTGNRQGKSALAGQYEPVKIQVQSMRELLGKDADLHVNTGSIRIIDPNLHIKDKVTAARVFPASSPSLSPAFRPVSSPAPPRQAPVPAPPAWPAPTPAVTQPTVSYGGAQTVAPSLSPSPTPAAESRARSNPWEAWEREVEELARAGNKGEAFARIEEAIRKFPQSARLLEIRSRTLQRFGMNEEALKGWLDTFKQAMSSGSSERAERAWSQAQEIAKENADLLHEIAKVGHAAGAGAAALATAKLAADTYRRRNERPKLMAVLRTLSTWDPSATSIRSELARLENELTKPSSPSAALSSGQGWSASTVAGNPTQQTERLQRDSTGWSASVPGSAVAGEPALTRDSSGWSSSVPASGTGTIEIIGEQPEPDSYARTRPPSVPSPKKRKSAGFAAPRGERALKTDIAGSDASQENAEKGVGTVMVIVALFLLLVSVSLRSPVPSFIGMFITSGVKKQYEQSKSGKSPIPALGVAKFLCVLGVLIGFLSCAMRVGH